MDMDSFSPDKDMPQTGVYRMKHSMMAVRLFVMYGKPWVAAFTIMLLLSAIASLIAGMEWMIVVLMLLFILLPAMLATLYLFHGLKPMSVANIVEHDIAFGADAMDVTFYMIDEDDDRGVGENQACDVRAIPYSEFSNFSIGADDVTLIPRRRGDGFLWIPVSSFADSDSFVKAVGMIAEGIRNTNETKD